MRVSGLRLVRAIPQPVSLTMTFGANADPAPNLVQGGAVGLDWQNLKIVSNTLVGTQTGNNAGTSGPPYDDSTGLFIHPTGKVWPADQDVYATTVITDTNTAGPTYRELEIRLRSAIGPHINSGYECLWRCTQNGDQYMQIVRWNGTLNSFDVMKDAVAPPGILSGYQIRAAIVGTVITCYQRANSSLSWSTVVTHDLTSSPVTGTIAPIFTAGAPGLGTWIRGNTDASKACFSDAFAVAA